MLLRGSVAPDHAGLADGEDPDLATLRLPLVRLLQLVMILQSGRSPNARQLAEACAVSRRTIYRDLATLEAAGIGVIYRADRQGYQLAEESFLQPVQLSEPEALALLLFGRLSPAAHPFSSLKLAQSGVHKVIQTLPGDVRRRVTAGGELFTDLPASPDLPPDRRAVYEAILSAIKHRHKMRLWYREDPRQIAITTKFSLYRLAQIRACWSVVGRSTLHREIRLFRVPWIERVELTEESYSIPPRFRLDRWLRQSEQDPAAEPHCDAQLRFTAVMAPAVRDAPSQPGQTLADVAGGGVDLFLKMPLHEASVSWILGFGDQVEVVRPQQLRRAVKEGAERIARLHSEIRD